MNGERHLVPSASSLLRRVAPLAALALLACDDDGADCVVGDHELAVGETVHDLELGVVCTCSVDGPGCKPLAGLDVGPSPHDGGAPPSDAASPDLDAASPVLDARRDTPRDGATVDPDGTVVAPDGTARDRWVPPVPDATPDVLPDAPCGFGGECPRAEAVCARWASRHELRDRGGDWDGNLEACEPGDMTQKWRRSAVAKVNVYRYLAGLPDVESDEELDAKAQQCALALNARGAITHHLEEDDPCYSDDAALAAMRSNIHSRPAVSATIDYIADHGPGPNYETLVHRLWILSANLGPVGVGSTNAFSCLWVAGGARRDDPLWVPWPPPGPFPFDAGHADRSGWSVHSNRVNMVRSTVTVTVDGEERPVRFRQLRAEGGASHGIAFVPDGWRSEAGTTYRVVVNGGIAGGAPVPIEYEVEMIACPPPS